MKLTKIIFSYDRPLQLDGLCRSLLHNSDLVPANIACICRASDQNYRRAYIQVGAQLGVRIVHENRLIAGIDLRTLQNQLAPLQKLGRLLLWGIYRLTTPMTLKQQILTQSEDTDFVSLAVDDMVYFQRADFAQAMAVLHDRPEIALWSWRIGQDLQPHPNMNMVHTHWELEHFGTSTPYNYVFHTDGSVYRRQDLEQWLNRLPLQQNFSLNHMERYLWARYREHPDEFPVGPLHAGPRVQACITWQINRVSLGTTVPFFGADKSAPASLLQAYLSGTRMDSSPLYDQHAWIERLNQGQANTNWTHVAPTPEALDLWATILRPPK